MTGQRPVATNASVHRVDTSTVDLPERRRPAPLVPSGSAHRRPDVILGVVAIAMVGAFVVRLAQVNDSLFGDELFTYVVSSRSNVADVLAGVSSSLEVTPPLHSLLAWLAGKLGDPHEWIRVPAIIASTATVPLVYALGARAGSRAGGAIGAVAWAIAPFSVFYGVEARGYSLMACLVAASTVTLMRAVQGGRWPWVVYAALTAATVYTHYTSVFAIGAQALWVALFHRRAVLPLLACYASAAIAFLPWLGELRKDQNALGSVIISFLSPLTVRSFFEGTGRWLAGTPFLPLSRVPGTGWALLIAGGIVLAGAGTAARVGRRPRRRPALRPELVLVVLVAVAAPAGVVAASLVGNDIFMARNLMSSLPAVMALAGLLLAAPARPVAAAATAAVLVGLLAGTVRLLEADQRRTDWKSAAAFVDRVASEPGDVVYEYGTLNLGDPPWRQLDINLRREHRRLSGQKPLDPGPVRAAGRRIVVVKPAVPGPPLTTPSGYRLAERRRFRGLVPLDVFVFLPVIRG